MTRTAGRANFLAARAMMTALLLCLALTGCERTPPADVVLYVSADEHIARQVISAFEAETGLRVDFLTDTEAQKTTGLVERLRSEQSNPQADVFWSSEVFLTIALAEEGVLAAHTSDAAAAWPTHHKDSQSRWFGMAARPRVIVYAPARISESDLPRTWMALTEPRWRDRVVMADPRFGTTGGHLGAMLAYWNAVGLGEAYYNAWLEGLAANNVRMLPGGNAAVVEAVARGEADVGMTDTDDVYAALARGFEVAMIYPDHRADGGLGAGTLLIPNTVALINGAKHQEAAGQLIDFLLSESTERLLAESISHNVPLNPALEDAYEAYRPPRPLRVNWTDAAAAREDAIELAMRWLTGAGTDE